MKTKLFWMFLTFIFCSSVYLPISIAQDYTTWHLPEGATKRLGKGSIHDIAYSPDGNLLAVASSIGVWLYDAESSEEHSLLLGHTGNVVSVSFSPNGQMLASGGGQADGTVRLWDVETGQNLQTLIVTNDVNSSVRSVSFRSDGQALVSTDVYGLRGAGRIVHLWNVNTGELLKTLEFPSDTYSEALSPDGQTLASGSWDGNVRLWDVDTGKLLETLIGHSGLVVSLAFRPNGQTLASASADGTIRLWNVNTGLQVKMIFADANNVLFSPNGQTLASGGVSGDFTVRLWNVNTSQHVKTFIGHTSEVENLSFSPDGRTLVSGSWDGTVFLWNVTTGQHVETFTGHAPRNLFLPMAFSPDGRTLASGHWNLHLWNVATGKLLKTFIGHTNWIGSVAFSPDGQTLASASHDTIRLWDVATGLQLKTFTGHRDSVNSVSFSPDGQTLASGGYDATVRLWNVATGKLLRTLEGHKREHLELSGFLSFAGVLSVSFSPDGQTLASGGGTDDFTVRLWDVETGRNLKTLIGHTGRVNGVSFSPDGQTLISGSTDGSTHDRTVRLWDVETGRPLKVLKLPYGTHSVAFSPDGQTLASGDRDGHVHLWDVTTEELLKTLQGHTDWVWSVSFNPDGQTLASAGDDGTVLLWDITPTDAQTRLTADVNGDGQVDIQDLVLVASNLGETQENAADVNGDQIVDIRDLIDIAAAIDRPAAAPALDPQALSMFTTEDVQRWIAEAQHLNLTDWTAQKGIRFLEQLLTMLIPKTTALLFNYPNPFNPETWIPYQLSISADVRLTIHDIQGHVVRDIDVGHQRAGMYHSRSRAAYWDGKNAVGEPVASGIYFYTLTAGDFTATRKMLIRK